MRAQTDPTGPPCTGMTEVQGGAPLLGLPRDGVVVQARTDTAHGWRWVWIAPLAAEPAHGVAGRKQIWGQHAPKPGGRGQVRARCVQLSVRAASLSAIVRR